MTGRVAFYAAAYLLSFGGVAREFWRFDLASPELLVALGPALLFTAAALAVGLRRKEVEPLARGEAMLMGGAALAFAIGLQLERGGGAVLVANLALAFLAAGRVMRGLTSLARGAFWEGIAVGGVLVVSRFLELDGDLWIEGAGFIVAGLAVLAAGIAFERKRSAAAELG
ncbi:MAG: hypothetical protein QM767_22025 [Anaeromyxobacter sp.]